MARKLKLHPEIEQTNRRTLHGQEIAKLLPNGEYVINYHALYNAIVMWSFDPAHPVKVGALYREFGMRENAWGEDTVVRLALADMADAGIIKIEDKKITPLVGKIRAAKMLPPYTPLAKTLAGLHSLDEIP